MKIFVQIILILVLIITLIGSIAEADKNKSLSQQLTAICSVAALSLGISFFA